MADGVLKMNVEMGGYLQSGYSLDVSIDKNPESPMFGTRLHNNMAGLLHDLIIGVKADLVSFFCNIHYNAFAENIIRSLIILSFIFLSQFIFAGRWWDKKYSHGW